MFIVSKIAGWLTQPLTWLLLCLVGSWLLSSRHPRAARRTLGAGVFLLALLGWEPLPDLLLHHLESRYAEMAPDADLRGYAGVVVLGGGTESGRLQQSHRQPLLNTAGGRLSASAALALRNKHLLLLYTGGEGELNGEGPSEASRAKLFYDALGVPPGQVLYESASRTTYDNAIMSAQLSGVDKRQRWLLLTSAWHMPRAMATFAHAGWNVTAYPVDYRAEDGFTWSRYSLLGGTTRWHVLMHEAAGLLAYWLSGRM